MKAATLAIYQHLFASVAEQMGVTLGRTSLSPNIKERLDFSCAIFTSVGQLLAQAAHIPVHLGAMPASVQAAIENCQPFAPGDVIILNDPYLGGTHLPDITMVSPVFALNSEISVATRGGDQIATGSETSPARPSFFVASRAHHADIGGMSPGSMPLSDEIYQEGLIIPPVKIVEAGRRNEALWRVLLRNVRTPDERDGDLHAQLAANVVGIERLLGLIERYGLDECLRQAHELIRYAERMTRAAIAQIPDGRYRYTDFLDSDGQSDDPIPIKTTVSVKRTEIHFDFTGTSRVVAGNLNAVPSIAISAAAYCLRCIALAILGAELPMNQGAMMPMAVHLPEGSMLRPPPPSAVAAGNVETSQRIVDVIFGALAQALPDLVPAASQGSMNNLTLGALPGWHPKAQAAHRVATEAAIPTSPFAYYETIGGGVGAGPTAPGGHGMHVHMSNTRNTPIEDLEYSFPLRVTEYRLRRGSGGKGLYDGGDGLIRGLRFLAPARVTIVSERRRFQPYGLNGGRPGDSGQNRLIRGEEVSQLAAKSTCDVQPGDIIRVETPGGGGWGKPR